MKIYAIVVETFSSDIYGETYIDSYWSTLDKAETRIIKLMLEKTEYPMYVQEIILDEKENL